MTHKGLPYIKMFSF